MADSDTAGAVELVVLGTGQDGGAPQAGHDDDPGWADPTLRRTATCIGLVDRIAGKRFLLDATPDFRDQLHRFSTIFRTEHLPLSGILLTHAHIGHYTGLMFLGREAMDTSSVPVYAMPRMASFLATNGPWSQLVALRNIEIREMADRQSVELSPRLRVTPLLVPHRQEFSEVVGFRVEGPSRRALFIPDIDRWNDWDQQGVRVEDEIRQVDVAYLDGTFFDQGELPGRDRSDIPHPTISSSMARFVVSLPEDDKSKVRFIHLNWSNPARFPSSRASLAVEEAGMRVAQEMESVLLCR